MHGYENKREKKNKSLDSISCKICVYVWSSISAVHFTMKAIQKKKKKKKNRLKFCIYTRTIDDDGISDTHTIVRAVSSFVVKSCT